MSDLQMFRPVTIGEMLELAKKLRIKAYYDTGNPEGDDAHSSAVREGRSSALVEMAEVIDETMKFNSELTQADLEFIRGS